VMPVNACNGDDIAQFGLLDVHPFQSAKRK